VLHVVDSADFEELAWIVTASFLGLTLLSSALGYALEYALRERRVFALPLDPGQTRVELIGNLVFLAVAIPSFSVVLHLHLIRFADATALRTLLTFVAMYLGFQASYYALHRALHTRSLVRFHRWHHRSRVTTPLSGQSMDAVEAVGWMLCYLGVPALMSRALPLSFDGFFLYILYNVFGNIFGHANVEPVPAMPGLRYFTLLNNVFTFHSLHHARWTAHYGFATALFDRIFGTEWDDWMALHRSTSTGHPLPSLHTRGDGHAASAGHGPAWDP
jgi:sterol desaturase/sphingolipid hydroxylase (fatty acid hydroxylase superfamily)